MKPDIYDILRHFARHELEKEGAEFDPMVAVMADQAREDAGIAFIVNRGADTSEGNEESGGEDSSLHLPENSPSKKARAIDIKRPGDPNGFFRMIRGLMRAGFNQILVYEHHIHVEFDQGKTLYLAWKEY